jgi:hypothetical protein
VGVVRQLTSSKPAAAPDTSGYVPFHLHGQKYGYSPKNAEARAVTILIPSGVFLGILWFFIMIIEMLGKLDGVESEHLMLLSA